MTWFKVDDGFHSHPDVYVLLGAKGGLSAIGLWTVCGSYCAKHLTNGRLTTAVLRRLGGTVRQAKLLCEVGLWEETGRGEYQFRNWCKYQPTKEKVEKDRADARNRMRDMRSGNVRANKRRTSSEVRDVFATPVPSRPDPINPPTPFEPDSGPPEQKPEDYARAYREATGNSDLHDVSPSWDRDQLAAYRQMRNWCGGDLAKLRAEFEALAAGADDFLRAQPVHQWAKRLGTSKRASNVSQLRPGQITKASTGTYNDPDFF